MPLNVPLKIIVEPLNRLPLCLQLYLLNGRRYLMTCNE